MAFFYLKELFTIYINTFKIAKKNMIREKPKNRHNGSAEWGNRATGCVSSEGLRAIATLNVSEAIRYDIKSLSLLSL